MYAISRAAAVLVMAGLLLGCATAAQRQYQAIAVNNRAALQGYEGCVTAIYDQPELEPLRHDLPRNVQNASLAQLANSSFVSPEQTRLILANHPKYQACRQQFINQIAPAMPAVATVVLKGATDTDNRIVGLLQKKLRWGEFLQQWREANQGSQGELPRRGWQHCGKLAAIARGGDRPAASGDSNFRPSLSGVRPSPGDILRHAPADFLQHNDNRDKREF